MRRAPGAHPSPALVGRREELAQLAERLRWAVAGRASAVLIAGEAGVGKTRLVEEVLARAEAAGALPLIGGCIDVERERVPLAPFIEAVRPHLAPGSRWWGRGFELFLSLIRELATRSPVVLALEDLHWSDRSTRDLLAFLIRNLVDERIVLIATFRSDELYRAHPLRPFLAELERAGRPDRIDVQPLDRDTFGSFVSGRAGGPVDAALVDSLLARSGGNPFLADALIAAGSGPPSPSLRRVLVARAERLAPTTRHLLDLLAVGDASVPDRLLAALSPLPESARYESLHEAIEHGVILSTPTGAYAFRHEVVREAILEELLPVERARISEAYAAARSSDSSPSARPHDGGSEQVPVAVPLAELVRPLLEDDAA